MAPIMNHFKFLQTISLLYVLLPVTFTASSLSHSEECSPLFQFKQTIIHQDDLVCASHGSQVLHSWNTSFICCSWEGVSCDQYGHVIGLDLAERSICGQINSSSTLFSLVHLQILNLTGNDFGGSQIPSEIARLKQLKSLDLSAAGFSGQIPNEISQLVQLSSLDLSGNSLKLHSPRFKNLVQNITGLEELHLSGVDISSSIPHFLANFSSLKSIELRDCLLKNEIPAALFELPKLQILDLGNNTELNGSLPKFYNNSLLEKVMLYRTGLFGIVPESISHLKHLTSLGLGGCSFSGPIPRSLSNMTQLTFLLLSGNKFIGFVPSLVSLSKLVVLELNGNKFEKGHIPNWLGKLAKLSELYLFDMNINGEIPLFLANLTKLTKVEMGKNSLTGRIPSWFLNQTLITLLDLQQNHLQGPIPNTFFNFKGLNILNLRFNNFSGRVELGMFLGLNELQTLLLGNNVISLVVTNNNYTNATLPEFDVLDLSSCDLNEFPAFLRFQNKLSVLGLDNNNIHGLVPMWMWNNSRETLEVIELSGNSINGFDQHPHFLPWRSLKVFAMGNNQLQGEIPVPPQTTVVYIVAANNLAGPIPPWICELKALQLLDMSLNNMSGRLPSCLGILSNSLTALTLKGNNFHGKMIIGCMPGSPLKGLDLSENRFTGQLPRSLKDCTNLEVLSLGDNQFHDVFPSWLGSLANLQVLVLRSNKLYGPIQGSTTVSSHFPKLRIIDVSNNNFSGQLDQNIFQTWHAMSSNDLGIFSVVESVAFFKTIRQDWGYTMTLIHKGVKTEYERILTIDMAIDLSRNNFKGQIPKSLQNLRGLQSLNLSYNHFTGCVLPYLRDLKHLEALDLSANELTGEIPQQLVVLNFLEIFNVSFNHLEGRIPKGKQFDTFDNSSYIGNPRLCGQPLSKECEDSKVSRLPPTSNVSESESLFPIEIIDWIIVFCGVGSGLAVGIVVGNFLYERYSDLHRERKDRWVRPLCNRRKNQGSAIGASSKGKEKA